MDYPTFNPFLVGCIGALAPEIIRLYKLRFNPNVRWSWGYLLFSVPFVLLGGFMAYILEPTTSYAAFYTGVSTPFIVTTLTKDAERDTNGTQRLPHYPPSTSNDNVSDHSALRGSSLPSVAVSPPSLQYHTGGRLPQSPSRPYRSRISKRKNFQSFLDAL